jgi:hypothetical protein
MAAVAGSGVAAAWLLAGPGSVGVVTTDAIGDKNQRLPAGRLPEFADTADTRRLYGYAMEHGDELQYVPCFCGCYRYGHKNNLDCYVKATHPDGMLTFTSHAAT